MGAPELLKAEMPLVRYVERDLEKNGVKKTDIDYQQQFKYAITYYRQFGNIDKIKSEGDK